MLPGAAYESRQRQEILEVRANESDQRLLMPPEAAEATRCLTGNHEMQGYVIITEEVTTS